MLLLAALDQMFLYNIKVNKCSTG